MITIRNKRWQLRNGNQVLRDIRQTQVAVVYPSGRILFAKHYYWAETQEAARDAAERMALDAGYRLAERVTQ